MKVVTLLSGGLDSSTLLGFYKSRGYDVTALTILYGQKHAKEVESAKKIAKYYKVKHIIVDMSNMKNLLKSALTDDKKRIPHGYYTEESQKQTVVPNRNMILLSIATGVAISEKADVVAYAAHKSDSAIYPDCRKEFVKSLSNTIKLCDYNPPKLETPFIDKTKKQIVKIALELQVPLQYTWSCYEGGKRPCLKCGTCVERIEAFYENNTKDPLLTNEEWEKAIENLRKLKKRGV